MRLFLFLPVVVSMQHLVQLVEYIFYGCHLLLQIVLELALLFLQAADLRRSFLKELFAIEFGFVVTCIHFGV